MSAPVSASEVEQMMRDAGYLLQASSETWVHPLRQRALPAAVAAIMDRAQLVDWITQGAGRTPLI